MWREQKLSVDCREASQTHSTPRSNLGDLGDPRVSQRRKQAQQMARLGQGHLAGLETTTLK